MDGRHAAAPTRLIIFNAVYESGPRKVKMPAKIAAELYTAVQLAPFLRLADGGLQARVCGLGIGEGGRLVGPLPGLFKLEGGRPTVSLCRTCAQF